MKWPLALAGLLMLFGTAAWAKPRDQAPPLYVLAVDSQGRWQADRQERFHFPKGLDAVSGLSCHWKSLLDTRFFGRLSYSDRLALMTYPERLLASTWADEYFAARHVVVLHPMGEERIEGRLFDLGTGIEMPLVVSQELAAGGSPRDLALSQALAEAAISREQVLAHPDGLYHRVGAPDLLPQVHYEPVESAERAEAFGFRACQVCYPQAARDPLYDNTDRALGQVVAAQIEATYPVLSEGDDAQRVQTIGQRLLRESRFLDQGYQFKLLDTETANAYAAPTGPVYVTTGMLAQLKSDDELAAVLGHELSHSEHKHARKQYEQSKQAGLLGLALTLATGFPWASLGTDILGTVMVRGYSRGYELEADRDGMMMAYAAGYDPQAYLSVQDTLAKIVADRGRDGGPGWLQTHPHGDQRKAQLEEILKDTAPLRERLEKLQTWDPGMAGYLKGRVLFLADDFQDLDAYLTCYETFAHASERPPLTIPRDTPIEVWETMDQLLAPAAELDP